MSEKHEQAINKIVESQLTEAVNLINHCATVTGEVTMQPTIGGEVIPQSVLQNAIATYNEGKAPKAQITDLGNGYLGINVISVGLSGNRALYPELSNVGITLRGSQGHTYAGFLPNDLLSWYQSYELCNLKEANDVALVNEFLLFWPIFRQQRRWVKSLKKQYNPSAWVGYDQAAELVGHLGPRIMNLRNEIYKSNHVVDLLELAIHLANKPKSTLTTIAAHPEKKQ